MLVIGPHRQTLICVWAVGGGVLDAPGNLAIIATFRANRRGGFYIRPGRLTVAQDSCGRTLFAPTLPYPLVL